MSVGGTAACGSARLRGRRLRGFATLIVLLAVAISTVILLTLQASAFRQAAAGREAVARVRAKWAARAGLEATIARLEFNILNDDQNWSFTQVDDMRAVASGQLEGTRWEIRHDDGRGEVEGPADPHAKVNINRMITVDLMELPNMTEDVAAAIIDWIDEDDIVTDLGAESGYYSQLPSPYAPRNGPMRTLFELDLVAGVDPTLVRGEDWNLNGRLDPNENDGDLSFPPDNADGVLDAGWSAHITTRSVDVGIGVLGAARLDLNVATADQVVELIGIEPAQADTVLNYITTQGGRIEDLIGQPLSLLASAGGGASPFGGAAQSIRNLTDEQLRKLIDLATTAKIEDGPVPGRVNINTVRRETLDYISIFRDQGAGLADLLILWRDQRPNGFGHILDLLDIPGISRGLLTTLSQYIDVRSNAYVVTSRGRDTNSGIEVEIVTTIERTTLPVVITEMHVR